MTCIFFYRLKPTPIEVELAWGSDVPSCVPEGMDYDPATSWGSGTSDSAAGFFAGMVVIASTLTRIRAVPTMVRSASGSPPRKYPTSTATIGFTYAYVPTFVGDSW